MSGCITKQSYKGDVYCVSVFDQNVVTRRNNKVVITGNSIHSEAYAYIIETLLPAGERDSLYDYWKTNALVNKRCEQITDRYQEYLDRPTPDNFAAMVLGDFILEGIAFYAGFYYFHALASRHLMTGTNALIILIKRDEKIHLSLFNKLVTELKSQGLLTSENIEEQLMIAYEQEISFWTNILEGRDILGFSLAAVKQFTNYLFNQRAMMLGANLAIEDAKNPFKHLDVQNDETKSTVKGNFFDSSDLTYSMASQLEGWDEDWDEIDETPITENQSEVLEFSGF
jgi:ribonucleoside-diphosphate reductase beta chain